MRVVAWLLVLAGVGVAQISFVSAADAVRPSLVSIVTDKVEPSTAAAANGPAVVQNRALGSGFVLDTLGHILTCNHVVTDYGGMTVRFADDRTYGGSEVAVVGQDPVTDLAVIRVKAKRTFAPAELGNSDELEVGQPVMAMGSPFGLEGTATAGIVSGLSRWGQPKASGPDFQDFIQTDAPINPGNSGGPLVDLRGRVVGVNSFIRTARSGPTGIGFAIPINLAKTVAGQIIRDGKVIRGLLGISTQPITDGISQALGLPSCQGVLVSSVEPDQPGGKAGILPGDAIVSLNSRPIPDARWFQSEVAGRGPGTAIELELVRKGRKKLVTATLGSWTTPTQPRPRVFTTQHWLGLVVNDSRATATRLGELDYGVVVSEVEGGSTGADAGLRSGDVIAEINLAPVRSLADFDKIQKVMMGSERPLLLRVFRGHQAFYTTVEP